MISTFDRPSATNGKGNLILTDGTLGGCGLGPIGDPNTYLTAVWESLLWEVTSAKSVLDVGCGFGHSCKFFEGHGCEVLGLEGSKLVVEQRVTECVQRHDFTLAKPVLTHDFDLGWCCEFVEHVPAEYEPNIFAAFVRCKVVVLGAALPGFRGHNHVNCQPSSYWIERFKEHGFRCDLEESDRLRALAAATVPESYFQHNGLVFIREKIVDPKLLWTDVEGWITKEQGDFLRRATEGKTVLELGAWKGRSTICMAQVARQITTIDHFHGDDSTGHNEVLAEFLVNVKRFGLEGKIEPIIGDFDAARESITTRRFQVVFVDGAHDAGSVARDTLIALECLLPGGLIIWHDYQMESVKAGIAETGIPMDGVKDLESVGFLQTEKHKVIVVMPHSRVTEIQSVKSAMRGGEGRTADQLMFFDLAAGCLTWNFNSLLAHCLNLHDARYCTHMAMLHSDIAVPPGWVDILSEEMCMTRAAVISAVVAIKDPDDDRTSTSIGVKGEPWHYRRYIRLRDRSSMPETFTGKDVCEDGEVLLINTGCMLIDLSHEFWDTFVFDIENRIIKDEDGKRGAQFLPEDWKMSRELDAANIPYAATWKVRTQHIGPKEWGNEAKLLTPVGATPEVEGHANG